MDKQASCFKHGNLNEIYCKTCKSYICSECLQDHASDGHIPQYLHIFSHAAQDIVPLFDKLAADAASREEYLKGGAAEFLAELGKMVTPLKEKIKEYNEYATFLQGLAEKLEKHVAPVKGDIPAADRIKQGLENDKKRVKQLLKDRNTKECIRVAQKIEAEATFKNTSEHDSGILKAISDTAAPLQPPAIFKPITESIQLALFRCQQLKLNRNNTTPWVLDRKYLTSKMTLSEDNLTYGNSAGSGYPAIIGDTPFESGIWCFEVTPTSLECSGNEGFGIIELEEYKRIFAADSTTPTAYSQMSGMLYGNTIRNMRTVRGGDMRMSEPYQVKVDLIDNKFVIKGRETLLEGDLKPETVYVPCFSCGCRNNKIAVKLIDSFPDE